MLEGHDVAQAILWVVTQPRTSRSTTVLVRPTEQKN
jgi:NADP-dependent 3-hydroxy acid dehydrogenase YdfG